MKLKDFLIAVLIFAPTITAIPQQAYLLYCILPFICLPTKNVKYDLSFNIILVIFLLSLLNQALHVNQDFGLTKSSNNYVPYSFFMVVIFLSLGNINKQVLHFILIFIIIEIGIGIFEYAIGVPFLFTPKSSGSGETEFGTGNLLYYNRVFGISTTTSAFALKVFVGFLIFYFIGINNKIKVYLFLGLLLAGLYITFNRSAIGASVAFLLLYLANSWKYKLRATKANSILFTITITLFIAGILAASLYSDEVINQFNRGRSVIDYSSRDTVYSYYSDFILSNLFFGNGSYKLWLDISGSLYHAHNSFLQTLANNGFFIFTLYLALILVNLNKNNYIYIIPILLYSLLQYGIFWGISFVDIIFFFFLFRIKSRESTIFSTKYEKDLEWKTKSNNT